MTTQVRTHRLFPHEKHSPSYMKCSYFYHLWICREFQYPLESLIPFQMPLADLQVTLLLLVRRSWHSGRLVAKSSLLASFEH